MLSLAFGCLLKVVSYRVPRGESLLRPAFHCPQSHHPAPGSPGVNTFLVREIA
jgi:prepilin signal peptidase PulO-like enzyme (type II secretory pathway)